MPIYKCTIAGVDKPRLIRADTPAAARNHLVVCKGVSAEEMSDLMEGGATIERAAAEAVTSTTETALATDEAAPRDVHGHTPAEGVAAIQDKAIKHSKAS